MRHQLGYYNPLKSTHTWYMWTRWKENYLESNPNAPWTKISEHYYQLILICRSFCKVKGYMCIIYFRSRYIPTQSKKMKSKTSHILYCTLYKHDSYRYHQCVQIKLRNTLLRFQDRFNVLMVCCHWYLTSNENLLRFISILYNIKLYVMWIYL